MTDPRTFEVEVTKEVKERFFILARTSEEAESVVEGLIEDGETGEILSTEVLDMFSVEEE